MLFFPSAYPVHIGPFHWELILRTRAVDNQFFAAGISSARNEDANYVVYGHSMIIDPIGNVLTKADTSEEIVFQEIGKNNIHQHYLKHSKQSKFSKRKFMCNPNLHFRSSSGAKDSPRDSIVCIKARRYSPKI